MGKQKETLKAATEENRAIKQEQLKYISLGDKLKCALEKVTEEYESFK